jgi:hypothetical protein
MTLSFLKSQFILAKMLETKEGMDKSQAYRKGLLFIIIFFILSIFLVPSAFAPSMSAVQNEVIDAAISKVNETLGPLIFIVLMMAGTMAIVYLLSMTEITASLITVTWSIFFIPFFMVFIWVGGYYGEFDINVMFNFFYIPLIAVIIASFFPMKPDEKLSSYMFISVTVMTLLMTLLGDGGNLTAAGTIIGLYFTGYSIYLAKMMKVDEVGAVEMVGGFITYPYWMIGSYLNVKNIV